MLGVDEILSNEIFIKAAITIIGGFLGWMLKGLSYKLGGIKTIGIKKQYKYTREVVNTTIFINSNLPDDIEKSDFIAIDFEQKLLSTLKRKVTIEELSITFKLKKGEDVTLPLWENNIKILNPEERENLKYNTRFNFENFMKRNDMNKASIKGIYIGYDIVGGPWKKIAHKKVKLEEFK